MYGVGVYGAGYWAQNGLRVISESRGSQLVAVCDIDAERLDTVKWRYPHARATTAPDALIDDPAIDVIYIATPPHTHAPLARAALEAGKHVLVEKPLTDRVADAERLVDLAAERGLTLMVGHTFLYSAPVLKVKELLDGGVIGEVFSIDSQRVNLGRYQDSGVIWDLAPHDISILLFWLGELPRRVTASARSFVSTGREDVAFVTLEFPGGTLAQLHLSWLAPTRLRRMTLSGSERMVVYEDTAGPEMVKVYDMGVDRLRTPESYGEAQLTYRHGDLHVPRLDAAEPLKAEWDHFLSCVATGDEPRSSGAQGLAVVRTLAAIDRALVSGQWEPVPTSDATHPAGATAALVAR